MAETHPRRSLFFNFRFFPGAGHGALVEIGENALDVTELLDLLFGETAVGQGPVLPEILAGGLQMQRFCEFAYHPLGRRPLVGAHLHIGAVQLAEKQRDGFVRVAVGTQGGGFYDRLLGLVFAQAFQVVADTQAVG